APGGPGRLPGRLRRLRLALLASFEADRRGGPGMTALLVTAWLESPLAGDPPQLDALLEWSCSARGPAFRALQEAGLPHLRVDRQWPAPPQGLIPIPVLRRAVGEWQVACCSSP